MKASLDTNVVIHLYRANAQELLFKLFLDGIFIDEFILNQELKRHGQDVMPLVLSDIGAGKIEVVRKNDLKNMGILQLYNQYLYEEQQLYFLSDMGEVHAIALARSIGAISVVTDDTKDHGPHYALMRIPDSNIIPLTFYEALILLYLKGNYTSTQTIDIFKNVLDKAPELLYDLKSKIKAFIRRFIKEPYTDRDFIWFKSFCCEFHISVKAKMKEIVDKL